MSAPSTEDERCPRCDRRECNIGRVGLNRPETRGDYVGCVSNVVDWRQRYLATHQKLSDARAALRLHEETRAAANDFMEFIDTHHFQYDELRLNQIEMRLRSSLIALDEAEALATPAPVAVPATHDGSQCAHGNEDCGICT